MKIDWTMILAVAFAAIGLIEYAKGCAPMVPALVWRIAQPVVCLGLAVVFVLLPPTIVTGVMALALSQIGYEAVIETVKKRIGGGA